MVPVRPGGTAPRRTGTVRGRIASGALALLLVAGVGLGASTTTSAAPADPVRRSHPSPLELVAVSAARHALVDGALVDGASLGAGSRRAGSPAEGDEGTRTKDAAGGAVVRSRVGPVAELTVAPAVAPTAAARRLGRLAVVATD